MAKSKEQERIEAAVALGILAADCPGVLAGIQKMLETPWFIPLGKGERKRAKNVVGRLVKALGKSKTTSAQSEPAAFDLRKPKPTTKIRMALPDASAPPESGRLPAHVVGNGVRLSDHDEAGHSRPIGPNA